MVSVGSLTAAEAAGIALLVVGRFEKDVAVVRRVRGWPRAPALLGSVTALGFPPSANSSEGPLRTCWGRCCGGRAGGGPRSGHPEPTSLAAIGAGLAGRPRMWRPRPRPRATSATPLTVRAWRPRPCWGGGPRGCWGTSPWMPVGVRWVTGCGPSGGSTVRWSWSTTVRRAHRAWIRVWAMAEVTDEGAFDPAEFEDELAAAASNLEVGTRLWFQNDRIKVRAAPRDVPGDGGVADAAGAARPARRTAADRARGRQRLAVRRGALRGGRARLRDLGPLGAVERELESLRFALRRGGPARRRHGTRAAASAIVAAAGLEARSWRRCAILRRPGGGDRAERGAARRDVGSAPGLAGRPSRWRRRGRWGGPRRSRAAPAGPGTLVPCGPARHARRARTRRSPAGTRARRA